MFQGANALLTKLKALRAIVTQHFQLGFETLAGAGAASVSVPITVMTNANASQAVTLANGTYDGQVKVLFHYTGSGTATVTVASGDMATIVFDAVGDGWIGFWFNGKWHTIAINAVTFT
jgi:uncharacterized protein YdgA (DUF945 family)